jgi:hypothetical protein
MLYKSKLKKRVTTIKKMNTQKIYMITSHFPGGKKSLKL